MRNAFFKGHGLGNDYIAVDPNELEFKLTPRVIRAICDRNWGLGSDGILALAPSRRADFGVRIYNPDGSEAEKSGNGLRIFARYLWATRRTRRRQFSVETRGGLVQIALHLDGGGYPSSATVEMGRATFQPAALPCSLEVDELIEACARTADMGARIEMMDKAQKIIMSEAPWGFIAFPNYSMARKADLKGWTYYTSNNIRFQDFHREA